MPNEPFLADIQPVAFNFAPQGWAQCNGQLLPINQNQALFSLLGTTYGGNGQTNFALPDLRGRAPLHFGTAASGTTFTLGQKAGSETHTLAAAELGPHVHSVTGQANPGGAATATPTGNVWAGTPGAVKGYGSPADLGMNALAMTVQSVGSGQAHPNMQPFTTLNFVIALQGVFPSPT